MIGCIRLCMYRCYFSDTPNSARVRFLTLPKANLRHTTNSSESLLDCLVRKASFSSMSYSNTPRFLCSELSTLFKILPILHVLLVFLCADVCSRGRYDMLRGSRKSCYNDSKMIISANVESDAQTVIVWTDLLGAGLSCRTAASRRIWWPWKCWEGKQKTVSGRSC